jgi:gamma-glutamyl hercynylcysteine S-oxide synthase
MSLILTKEKIHKILKKKKLIIPKETILKHLYSTKNIFLKFAKSNEIINNYKVGEKRELDEINPLLWQYGHVVFFYISLVLKNLPNCSDFPEFHHLIEFYDSHKTPANNRYCNQMLDYNRCINLYIRVIDTLQIYMYQIKIGKIESYLIMLGILHNEMHNEALIFTLLNFNVKIDLPLINLTKKRMLEYFKDELITDITFIKYNDSNFIQGSKERKNILTFDNEMPSFKTTIKNFEMSKYPVTEYLYSQFIRSGGYENPEYWCRNGYKWIKDNSINLPKYWFLKGNKYFKNINGQIYETGTNLPMSNISYYEAQAYCKWRRVRLPLESEYEFAATNSGKTLYPWGNEEPNSTLCNINYTNNIVRVNEERYWHGENNKGISQLIGNIWEWCEEPIYPYNGFKIDPVYREMSYPFFGFKRICKGGCFAVRDFLIHPRYRNAQYPDCRIQFIGFRVCR